MLNTRFTRPPPADLKPCRALDAEACAGCASAHPGPIRRAVTAAAVRGMRRRTAAAYDAHPVVFVSDFLRQGFARVTGGIQRGDVVHNGVDVAALTAVAAEPALPRAAPVEVFAAGALTPYKGFAALLEAMHRRQLRPGVRLTIAGDGPDMPRLRTLAAELPVRLLGWTDHAQVLRLTRSADIVIVPSLCDEACATTLLEALALGRTVLALRRGGTPELTVAAGGGGQRLCLYQNLDELLAALHGGDTLPAAESAEQSLRTFGGSISAMTDALEVHYRRLQTRASAAEAGRGA